MLTTLKLKSIAVAAGAVAAMAAAAPANAFVYAMSHVDLQNLVLNVTGANTTLGAFSFDLTNTATLNAGSGFTSASCDNVGNPCSAVSPVLDAGAANAGGSTLLRTNNNFAFLGANNTDSYSGSDSVVKNAELVQGVPTNIEQIAESLLNINGAAKANAEIQSATSLATTVTVVADGAGLTLNFDADPDQRAWVNGLVGNYLAQSNLNASFTLTNNDTGGTVSWKPQGTGANDCQVIGLAGVTCSETADSQTLNFNVSTSLNPSDQQKSLDGSGPLFLTPFGINILNLPTATYSIAFNAVTSTSIRRQVPEPGTVGLIGAALLGLALTSVRRGRKQQ